MDGFLRVPVGDCPHQFGWFHQYPQLFLDLTLETSFESFSQFAFSSGEFPQAAQMIARPTLSNQ